eukprot:jgi/Mesvir1/16291/Mv13024-RA.1
MPTLTGIRGSYDPCAFADEAVKGDGNRSIKPRGGRTPLHVACLRGHPGVVKMLLDAGADANAADEDGRSPLLLFVSTRCKGVGELTNVHVDIIQLLVAAGANCNLTDGDGQSLLHVFLSASLPIDCFECCWAIVVELLAGGADPNARNAVREDAAM